LCHRKKARYLDVHMRCHSACCMCATSTELREDNNATTDRGTN
jgi:hypothetical protein